MLLDARASFLNTFVLKAGDTMTGALTVSAGGLSVEGGAVFNDAQADVDFRIEADNHTHVFFVDAGNARVGIRDSSPGGVLDMIQDSSTGAIPVFQLQQSDVDMQFMNFTGTAAAANLTYSLVDEGDQASETREGWIKVYIWDSGSQITNGTYYVPFYSLSA